jgi:hypothetical protein
VSGAQPPSANINMAASMAVPVASERFGCVFIPISPFLNSPGQVEFVFCSCQTTLCHH